jgi:hypothetical protein
MEAEKYGPNRLKEEYRDMEFHEALYWATITLTSEEGAEGAARPLGASQQGKTRGITLGLPCWVQTKRAAALVCGRLEAMLWRLGLALLCDPRAFVTFLPPRSRGLRRLCSKLVDDAGSCGWLRAG